MEPEKEMTLLLSHYCSSRGTAEIAKQERKIICGEGGRKMWSGKGTVAKTTTTRQRWRSSS